MLKNGLRRPAPAATGLMQDDRGSGGRWSAAAKFMFVSSLEAHQRDAGAEWQPRPPSRTA